MRSPFSVERVTSSWLQWPAHLATGMHGTVQVDIQVCLIAKCATNMMHCVSHCPSPGPDRTAGA